MMSGFTITILIPALDRLCDLMASQTDTGSREQGAGSREIAGTKTDAAEALKLGMTEALKAETLKAMEAPKTEAPKAEPTTEPPKAEPTTEAPKTEAPKKEVPAEPKTMEAPKAEPKPEAPKTEAPTVTLGAIQRAAGELSHAGKMEQVKALLPEFNIVKLSALKDDQLGAFAERLRALGAKI